MITKKKKSTRIEVDLTGPQGNAFYLLGLANELSRTLKLDQNQIRNELTSGDYENLVNTFDKHFGEFVTLYK